MVSRQVRGGLRFFRESKTEVVRGDAAIGRGESFNGSTKQEGPGHTTMNEDDGVTLAFVNVIHPAVTRIEFPECKGILDAVQPPSVCVFHRLLILRDVG
jgi:hypothetical protein